MRGPPSLPAITSLQMLAIGLPCRVGRAPRAPWETHLAVLVALVVIACNTILAYFSLLLFMT